MQRMGITDTVIACVFYPLYTHTTHRSKGQEKRGKGIKERLMRFKPILPFTTVIISFHKNGLECSLSKTSKQLHVITLPGDT